MVVVKLYLIQNCSVMVCGRYASD